MTQQTLGALTNTGADSAPSVVPSLRELTAASFKVGCLGFGGPAGQIALMHRIFVDEKKWIDEDRYAHALNYCMLLPGPEAQQLATYVGWLLHGVRGGIIAGGLFVLPGAVIVLMLSWLYVTAGQQPLVAAAFFGIKAAVFALVAEAMIRIGKRALKGPATWSIAVAAFLALFAWSAPFPLVILAAGVVGAVLAKGRPLVGGQTIPGGESPGVRRALATAAAWTAAWLAPFLLSLGMLGPTHILTKVGQLFSVLAVVTFGGAYATLAYLKQEAVDVEGWLTPGQMIDGLGLAETTPGPLVLVNEFVGYLAGWQGGAGGLLMAVLAAGMAAWCTFAPSFVWIFAGAPFAERLRTNRWANGVLQAITAAVLGVIANLAIWFAGHVLFGSFSDFRLPLQATIALPRLESFDLAAGILCVAALLALFRFRFGVLTLVLAAAASGVALQLTGLV
ncbi:MAG TPA: chromate efflux transporter [Hyphomonadaceae bacterium]